MTALLVPGAGPLISLGRADLLGLLLAPGVPVWIVDQVLHEVARDEHRPDARRCRDFVAANAGRVRVFETFVGAAAAAQRADPAFRGRQRGLGEAAIAEFLGRLDEVTGDPLSPVVVLFEDSDVVGGRFAPGPNTRLISTWSLLLRLEATGRIASAEAAWAAILASGRRPTQAAVDRPAPPGPAP